MKHGNSSQLKQCSGSLPGTELNLVGIFLAGIRLTKNNYFVLSKNVLPFRFKTFLMQRLQSTPSLPPLNLPIVFAQQIEVTIKLTFSGLFSVYNLLI